MPSEPAASNARDSSDSGIGGAKPGAGRGTPPRGRAGRPREGKSVTRELLREFVGAKQRSVGRATCGPRRGGVGGGGGGWGGGQRGRWGGAGPGGGRPGSSLGRGRKSLPDFPAPGGPMGKGRRAPETRREFRGGPSLRHRPPTDFRSNV